MKLSILTVLSGAFCCLAAPAADENAGLLHQLNVHVGEILEQLSHLTTMEEGEVRVSGCEVELRTWAHEHNEEKGFIRVNGVDILTAPISTEPWNRGVNVAVLRRKKSGGCDVIEGSVRSFDTHGSAEAGIALANHLSSQPAGAIIVAMSSDDYTYASNGIEEALPVLESMGVKLAIREYRSSFAFVAVKGSQYQAIVDAKSQFNGPTLLQTVL